MKTSLSLADKLTNEALIESSIAQRTTQVIKAKLLYLPEGGLGKSASFLNAGTIVTIVSKGRSEYLDGLEAAIKSKKADRVQMHCEAIVERTKRDTRQKPTLGGLDDIPLIVDVQYGNTWLAKHLLIGSHTQLAMSISVWSGGDLTDQAFRVHEHRERKSRVAPVEVVIILVPPTLSKIEKGVLKAVPSTLSEVHIIGPSVSWSAGGVGTSWSPKEKGAKPDLVTTDINDVFIPFYEKQVQQTTVDQRQAQQTNTTQQQQQQQQYHQDGQNHQQQQQQQRQNDGQVQQQQQEQHQQAQTAQQQDQNQQQQQAQTEQQQHDNYNQHAANTDQAQESGRWFKDEMEGGYLVQPIDQSQYLTLLSQIDFIALDATQSVKELLRLRERLITVGMG